MRPQEEQPQWGGSSGYLDSAPAVTPGLSVCRAWRPRGRAADLLSSWQECPCSPGPSRPLPVPGGGRILGCVLAPCALAPAPLDSCSRPCSPLHGAAPRDPLSCSSPAVFATALRDLSALSLVRRRCLFVSQGARGHPRLPGSCSNSLRVPFHGEGWCSSCFSGTGLSCPGETHPGLSPAPRGPLPLGGLLFLYFFFPVFPP